MIGPPDNGKLEGNVVIELCCFPVLSISREDEAVVH